MEDGWLISKIKAFINQVLFMTQSDISNFPLLETERLLLRRLRPSDDKEIFLLRNDAQVNLLLGRAASISREEANDFIQMITGGVEKGQHFYWAITAKENEKLLGTICIWNLDTENETAETGYELLPAARGKGLMTEALARILEFAFGELKLKRLEAYTHCQNERSISLLEKFNFKKIKPKPGNEDNELRYALEADLIGYYK